jgi:hypothetical protein
VGQGYYTEKIVSRLGCLPRPFLCPLHAVAVAGKAKHEVRDFLVKRVKAMQR